MSSEMMQCSHPQCECMAAATIDPQIGEPDETFCSPYCRSAYSGEEEQNCACGHPECDSP
jgi:hypothetical protein